MGRLGGIAIGSVEWVWLHQGGFVERLSLRPTHSRKSGNKVLLLVGPTEKKGAFKFEYTNAPDIEGLTAGSKLTIVQTCQVSLCDSLQVGLTHFEPL